MRTWGTYSRILIARAPGMPCDLGHVGLKPHLTETFKLSSDPPVHRQGLRRRRSVPEPPEGALVLCVDEKSQIQALDRTAPVLPLADRAVEAPIPPLKRLLSAKWEVAVLIAVAERRAPRRQGSPPVEESYRTKRPPHMRRGTPWAGARSG